VRRRILCIVRAEFTKYNVRIIVVVVSTREYQRLTFGRASAQNRLTHFSRSFIFFALIQYRLDFHLET